MQAIRQRAYDLSWESSGGVAVGPLLVFGGSSRGTEQYRGTAAVRAGIGLVAGGIMFGTWGLVLVRTAVRPPVSATGRRVRQVVAAGSLACLATTVIAFFPPWELGVTPSSTALYAVLLLTFLVAFGLTPAARERWARSSFFGLILVGVVGGMSCAGLAVGIGMGLLVALIAAWHVAAVLEGERR